MKSRQNQYQASYCPPGLFSISQPITKAREIVNIGKNIPYKIAKNENLLDYYNKPKLSYEVSVWFQFEKSSANISSFSKERLAVLLNYLDKYPTLQILLEGHTDNQGAVAKNLKLAMERVMIVKRYLVEFGISAKRISCRPLGGFLPVAPNDNEKNRILNSRVLVKVLNE